MKKVVGLCLAVLLCTGSVFAAPDRQKDKKQERANRCERMISDLKLNEQQAADFRRINEEFREKMLKEKESMEAERNQMREKMTTLMNEKNAAVKKVLTDEQYKLYLEKQKRAYDRNHRGAKGHRDGKGRW